MEVYRRRPACLRCDGRGFFVAKECVIVPEVAFINGAFVPLAEAKVSIEDRGFQFSDGIYEVIRTYKGRPFALEAHLVRLDRSAAGLDLTQPYSPAEWTHHILEGVRRSRAPEATI